jgi:FtsZ-binding cell division protein ZapB
VSWTKEKHEALRQFAPKIYGTQIVLEALAEIERLQAEVADLLAGKSALACQVEDLLGSEVTLALAESERDNLRRENERLQAQPQLLNEEITALRAELRRAYTHQDEMESADVAKWEPLVAERDALKAENERLKKEADNCEDRNGS